MSDAERRDAARPVPESETVTPPAKADRDRWDADRGAADYEPDVYVPADRDHAVGRAPAANPRPDDRDPGTDRAPAVDQERVQQQYGADPGVYRSDAGRETTAPQPISPEPHRYDPEPEPGLEPAAGREPVSYEPLREPVEREVIDPGPRGGDDDRATFDRAPFDYAANGGANHDRSTIEQGTTEEREPVAPEPVTSTSEAGREPVDHAPTERAVIDPELREQDTVRDREQVDDRPEPAPAIDPEPVDYRPEPVVVPEPVGREPESATREPGADDTATVARERGADVAHTAADEVKHVARTAREEGLHLAEEARAEARHIADDARAQLREQAEAQTERVTESMRRFGDQLGALADGRTEEAGPLAAYAGAAADELRRAAERVRDGGLDGVLDDTRRFARQRPALFLAGAVVAGFAAGRLLRGGKAAHDEHRDSADDPGTPVDGPAADSTPYGAPVDDPIADPAPYRAPVDGPAARTEEETWR
ncbi:hypothetical protein GCM10009853_047030 [Glycomyces scopariae]